MLVGEFTGELTFVISFDSHERKKPAKLNILQAFTILSGGQDSNLRPRGPKPRILPG
jgi:hypothetical protein